MGTGRLSGDGGPASTAVDLAKFASALFGGKLVNQSTLSEMKQTAPFDYGLGMFGGDEDGHQWYGHNGSYGGYESEDWTDPTRQVTIAVTADLDAPGDGSGEAVWSALAKAYDQSSGATTSCSSPSP